MSSDHDGTSDPGWPLAHEEALAVLRDMLVWYLPPPRWPEVSGVVEDLAEAAVAGYVDGLRETTSRLELFSPLRVDIRLGDVPSVLPAPKPVRDRVAELLTTLGRDKDQEAGDDPGRGDRRARA